jgi:hypothetical protein
MTAEPRRDVLLLLTAGFLALAAGVAAVVVAIVLAVDTL